ncbi:hypothetical protein CFC21_005931 [Triticum aestivum]|uniref:Uncharacterized protein n=4 Tax=Triticum TaxID=4564 RepID=A0A9R0QQS4_TRITD|nr:hypothetical protein TRIUR3_27007 [Triticum urartu]KAF6988385.1 hypothetical protein CFC21_005931 [Triticum aestivum]VAH14753.1 unnamed protein product [Triticum turgidum subsp. durum]
MPMPLKIMITISAQPHTWTTWVILINISYERRIKPYLIPLVCLKMHFIATNKMVSYSKNRHTMIIKMILQMRDVPKFSDYLMFQMMIRMIDKEEMFHRLAI